MKRTVFKPFDVEKAKQGAKILTSDGRDVRILSYDIKDEYYFSILAAIPEDDGYERVIQYNKCGQPNEADENSCYWLHIVEIVEDEDEKMLNSIQECLTLFFKKCKYDKESISKEDIFKWIKNKKEGLLRSECIDETWWIARDDDGTLCMYDSKPERCGDAFKADYLIDARLDGLFPEVTWENSPKEIKVNLELISDKDEENN